MWEYGRKGIELDCLLMAGFPHVNTQDGAVPKDVANHQAFLRHLYP
jgi:hypothetical protein